MNFKQLQRFNAELQMTRLRYDQETDEWTLRSGFDGDELLRPRIEFGDGRS
jgi:hypothetical protein